MNLVNRQAAIGAFTAVALVLGANASADGNALNTRSAMYGSLQAETREDMAVLRNSAASALRTCSNQILTEGLDLIGELAARLKQL